MRLSAGKPVRFNGPRCCALPIVGSIVIAALQLSTGRAQAWPCQYTVQVLPEVDCGLFQGPGSPVAINNKGWVIGVFSPCGEGSSDSFFWTGGESLTIIPRPAGASGVHANDLSASGLIVGKIDGPGNDQGFIYDINTQQYVAFVPPPTPNGRCALTGINETGFACGWRWTNALDPDTSTAFIYEIATGEITDLGTLGGQSSSAADINNLNGVTGTVVIDGLPQTFVWNSSNLTIIEPLFDLASGSAELTDDTVVVGAAIYLIPKYPFQLSVAFSWHNGAINNLGVLPGDNNSTARSINSAGIITGLSVLFIAPGQSNRHGVIWVDNELFELSSLVEKTQIAIRNAPSINDLGQILAEGSIPGLGNVTVVLTPNFKAGDITGNCAVNVDDLLKVINEWGHKESVADLNVNGVVDAPDLMIVIENWTFE